MEVDLNQGLVVRTVSGAIYWLGPVAPDGFRTIVKKGEDLGFKRVKLVGNGMTITEVEAVVGVESGLKLGESMVLEVEGDDPSLPHCTNQVEYFANCRLVILGFQVMMDALDAGTLQAEDLGTALIGFTQRLENISSKLVGKGAILRLLVRAREEGRLIEAIGEYVNGYMRLNELLLRNRLVVIATEGGSMYNREVARARLVMNNRDLRIIY